MTTYTKIFHANLSPAEGHPEDTYYFFAGGKRYPLTAHDDESRSQVRATVPQFAEIPDEVLTHYTADPVEISSQVTTRVHIGRYNNEGMKIVHLASMHVPEPDTEARAEPNIASAMPIARIPIDNFLRRHPHYHKPVDWISTAKTFLFHHPDVMTQDPTISRIIHDYMEETTLFDLINDLANVMSSPTTASSWVRLEKMQLPNWGAKGSKNINYNDLKTGYQHNPIDEVTKAAGPALKLLLKVTKNDNRLKNKKWQSESGTSVVSESGDSIHESEFIETPVQFSTQGWNAKVALPNQFHGLQSSVTVQDASKRQVEVQMNNYFIRYLSGYIQFFDASERPINNSAWEPEQSNWGTTLPNALGLQDGIFRALGFISPIETVCAIPDRNNPGNLTVTLTFPEKATSAKLYGFGLGGQGYSPYMDANILPMIFTGVFNLGIPTLLLAIAVVEAASSELDEAVEESAKEASEPLIDLFKDLAKDLGLKRLEQGMTQGKVDCSPFLDILKSLFTTPTGLEKVTLCLASMIAVEEAVDEIPFVGWAIAAVNIVLDAAQLAETIAEILISPLAIENTISITAPCNVTVHHDPRNHAFPQGESPSFTFKAIYKGGRRPTVVQHRTLSPNFNDSTLSAEFTNHLGGQVKFEADFYLGDWLAAKATTGWMDNNFPNTSNVTLYLVEFPVPLTSNSHYTHLSRLFYEDGTYKWFPTSEPCTATVAIASAESSGYAIGEWNGLALSQRHGAIGWACRAADTGLGGNAQLHTLQNVNIPGMQMQALKFSRHGFTNPTNIVYDVYPAKFLMKNGNWVIENGKPKPDPNDFDFGGYFLDSRNEYVSVAYSDGGGYHLRRIANLENSAPLVESGNTLSYGRFPSYPNPQQNNDPQVEPPNSIALHPSGYVIGVNSITCKIYILKLETEGKADKDAPVAMAFGGQATHEDRPGLLMSPVAVTCSYEGTILILEQLNAGGRIQAFDLNGNPVSCFAGRTPFLSLGGSDRTYLDIAAVGGHQLAYIYVLYYEGSGNNVSDYHMEIYRYGKKVSGNNYLVGTEGVAAAKLAVDMWHTVYTLNFGPTTDLQGHNAGNTVPSISEWVPPTP